MQDDDKDLGFSNVPDDPPKPKPKPKKKVEEKAAGKPPPKPGRFRGPVKS